MTTRKLLLSAVLLPTLFFDVGSSIRGSGGITGLSSNGVAVTSTLPFLAPSGTTAAPGYGFSAETTLGWYRAAAGQLVATINQAKFRIAGTQVDVGNNVDIGWSNNASPVAGSMDISLLRGGTTGALRVRNGTTPTSTNCGGAGLTITGNNTNGSIVLGAAPTLPCDINFNGTWTSAPHCYLNPEILTTGTTTVRATNISTTLMRITSTAALVATDKITWWCVGE